MRRLRWAAGLYATIILGSLAVAQPDSSGVEMSVQKLADGIYMLSGMGGNIGLSVGDEVILIDDDMAPMSDKLLAAVAELTNKPVSYLINTHWHFDHTGGNESMAAAGAVIVAHNNVRKRMSTEQFVKGLDRTFEASPPGALPVVTFAAQVSFFMNGDEFRVRHIHHAHTDGDAVIHIRDANVIHAGDTYWNGFYPFIDISSNGGIDGMIRAANEILALADSDTKIIPGHGPLSSRTELVEYRDMLETVRSRVLAMISNGFGKSAALKTNALRDLNEKWGGGFIKPDAFLATVYEDLAAK